jgi:pimeloyl-ACP methyl ester carboxylesterase
MLTEEGIIHIPGVLSRSVTLRSGAKAHYMTAGETGPSVILLHGGIVGSSGMAGWRGIMPILAKAGFRVYAPDRPGFGLCDIRPEHWPTRGVRSQVEFIRDFVEAVCLEEQFFLAGNSQGAQMGASYAVCYPERIKRMVLIASPAFHARLGLGDGMRRTTEGGRGPFDGTEEWMRKTMERIVKKKEAVTDELIKMRTMMANRDRECYAAGQKVQREELADPNLFHAVNFKDRLDKITIPTIFLWGKDDVLAPVEMGYELEKALPNMKFHFLEDCGHQAQTDRPQLVSQIFIEWFRNGELSAETLAEIDQPETQ